jgi:hypothetical protein
MGEWGNGCLATIPVGIDTTPDIIRWGLRGGLVGKQGWDIVCAGCRDKVIRLWRRLLAGPSGLPLRPYEPASGGAAIGLMRCAAACADAVAKAESPYPDNP